MTFRPIVGRDECLTRLRLVFPRAAFDPVLANPLGAAAVATMLYVDAVSPDEASTDESVFWARPSTCLWMSDEVLAHAWPEQRRAWRVAALRGRRAVVELLMQWGIEHRPWYGDNSRETLRDETFRAWLDHGAIRGRPGIPTTSSRPRWALMASFADLFDPMLRKQSLIDAVEIWRSSHMSPGDRFRILTVQRRERHKHAVTVTLPGSRQIRLLEPGLASLILKGVLEVWAPARLTEPAVLTISEPGDKVYLADAAQLAALGLRVDANTLLPDAVIVDIAITPPTFWIVEAVATNGPVTEERRAQLIRWAEEQNIPPQSCKFLSAFISRNDQAARRRLKDIAVNTYAWYADEPTRELAWYEIDPPLTSNRDS